MIADRCLWFWDCLRSSVISVIIDLFWESWRTTATWVVCPPCHRCRQQNWRQVFCGMSTISMLLMATVRIWMELERLTPQPCIRLNGDYRLISILDFEPFNPFQFQGRHRYQIYVSLADGWEDNLSLTFSASLLWVQHSVFEINIGYSTYMKCTHICMYD